MRKVPLTSPEIQQIVTEVYTSHDLLPSEWTPQRQRDFLDQEAARLSRQVAELAAELSEEAIQEWISRTGDHPDVMTKVGLVNNATLRAKEIVLSEGLYELIPPPPEEDLDESPPMPDRSAVPWDRRWTHTQYRTDPTEDQEDLVTAVWPAPDFSGLFRIKAGYLIAARAEDHQVLPTDRHDLLAAQLAQMVYADLRADGLPEK
ncbi:MAG: hypothetical protein QOF66_1806 [Mycobacterium sp.]|uniref:hypothetical protein n=1 Tax=Mycobacterium sp. TaxID=1785 RepID=UPI0028BB46CA|nr:hypothetical protein [Mycobacterium sp.]